MAQVRYSQRGGHLVPSHTLTGSGGPVPDYSDMYHAVTVAKRTSVGVKVRCGVGLRVRPGVTIGASFAAGDVAFLGGRPDDPIKVGDWGWFGSDCRFEHVTFGRGTVFGDRCSFLHCVLPDDCVVGQDAEYRTRPERVTTGGRPSVKPYSEPVPLTSMLGMQPGGQPGQPDGTNIPQRYIPGQPGGQPGQPGGQSGATAKVPEKVGPRTSIPATVGMHLIPPAQGGKLPQGAVYTSYLWNDGIAVAFSDFALRPGEPFRVLHVSQREEWEKSLTIQIEASNNSRMGKIWGDPVRCCTILENWMLEVERRALNPDAPGSDEWPPSPDESSLLMGGIFASGQHVLFRSHLKIWAALQPKKDLDIKERIMATDWGASVDRKFYRVQPGEVGFLRATEISPLEREAFPDGKYFATTEKVGTLEGANGIDVALRMAKEHHLEEMLAELDVIDPDPEDVADAPRTFDEVARRLAMERAQEQDEDDTCPASAPPPADISQRYIDHDPDEIGMDEFGGIDVDDVDEADFIVTKTFVVDADDDEDDL